MRGSVRLPYGNKFRLFFSKYTGFKEKIGFRRTSETYFSTALSKRKPYFCNPGYLLKGMLSFRATPVRLPLQLLLVLLVPLLCC